MQLDLLGPLILADDTVAVSAAVLHEGSYDSHTQKLTARRYHTGAAGETLSMLLRAKRLGSGRGYRIR